MGDTMGHNAGNVAGKFPPLAVSVWVSLIDSETRHFTAPFYSWRTTFYRLFSLLADEILKIEMRRSIFFEKNNY